MLVRDRYDNVLLKKRMHLHALVAWYLFNTVLYIRLLPPTAPLGGGKSRQAGGWE